MSISKILLCNKILSCYKICCTIQMLFFDVAYYMCAPLYMLILIEILWQLFWNTKENRRQLKVAQIFSGSLDHLINLECIEQLDLIYIYWISHEKVCFWYIFLWYIDISLIYQIGVYLDMLNSNLTINIHLIWTSHIIACTYSFW